MYRVFEALDELVTIVEEARGLPMTASCVVPRGDVLELLDDVRDALPGEVDDAQDVLDHRDQMIGEATEQAATKTVSDAQAEAHRLVSTAHADADATVNGARAEAERIWSRGHRACRGSGRPGPGRGRPDRAVRAGPARLDCWPGRTPRPSGPIAAGRASYEASVADGHAEQARLVSQTEVVQAAYTESARILDSAHADADRMRQECDTYVDTTLGQHGGDADHHAAHHRPRVGRRCAPAESPTSATEPDPA